MLEIINGERKMEIIREDQFEQKVLQSNKLVLVDFFASWCGPCQMIAPILEQVSKESNGEYEIYKVDVDQSQNLAMRFGVMSIPTLILFKNGQPIDKMIGFRPKNQIVEILNSNK
jgi:thioredoxin 1